jgi:hypothetical protein
LDTVFATLRTAIESTGRLTTVLEEKVTPNFSFLVLLGVDFSCAVSWITPRVGLDVLGLGLLLSNKDWLALFFLQFEFD